MEQFVLGIFQEQLSKFIIGFRKEQVNANLLNGKGEISNVDINCSFLNSHLSKLTPLVELERVHISKLSFSVTSWTNLRKAPIIIDIEHVEAYILEPLHYLDASLRKTIQQVFTSQLQELLRQGLVHKRGAYNLFDRILDNLTIEVRSILVEFTAWGKFKSRRLGPWSPPKLRAKLGGLRMVSVNEYGHEASPDEVWRHNHHRPSFMIYKKIDIPDYQVWLVPQWNTPGNDVPPPPPIPILSGHENKMELQLAILRRVKDGETLAVQLDVTIPKVEVNVSAQVLPHLYSAAQAVVHLLAKDRAFVDPLKPQSQQQATASSSVGENDLNSAARDKERSGVGTAAHVVTINRSDSASSDNASSATPMKETDMLMEEDLSSSSSDDDEVETKSIANSSRHGVSVAAKSEASTRSSTSSRLRSSCLPMAVARDKNDRPVIVLPLGLCIHEKISFSLSVHHATVRGTYAANADDNLAGGYVQAVTKGFIAEMIWPKVDETKGGYLQASVGFVSVTERFGSRVRTLLVGGAEREKESLASMSRPNIRPDESFPLYEERSIRPDPSGLRYTFPVQCFGLKTTVEFLGKSTHDDCEPQDEDVKVIHEVGLDHFDVVVDCQSWARALLFAINESGGGFDLKVSSGDWSSLMAPDMLIQADVSLDLEACIQPLKEILLDENDLLSSDLFNVTARINDTVLRMPAAIADDIRSCDIITRLGEATFVVSSALPRTFVSGKIGSSIYGEDAANIGVIDFPNDPSDVPYILEAFEDPSNRQRGLETVRPISTFRVQLTLRETSVRLVPIVALSANKESQQIFSQDELTMVICFEGEPQSAVNPLMRIALFASIETHRLEVCIDLDLVSSAAGTISYHAELARSAAKSCRKGFQSMNDALELKSDVLSAISDCSDKFSSRKTLVQRQLQLSRVTGGFGIAFCFKAMEMGVSIWRQNVNCSTPFGFDRDFGSGPRDSTSRFLPLVKLVSIEFIEAELGLEADFTRGDRRVVVKAVITETSIRTCDFKRLVAQPATRNEKVTHTWGDDHQYCSVEILKIGVKPGTETLPNEDKNGIVLRAEEQHDSHRSWAFAFDMGNTQLDCQIDAIETLATMLFEALLMPAWLKADLFPVHFDAGSWKFPEGSIGVFLQGLLSVMLSERDDSAFSEISGAIPDDVQRTIPATIDAMLRDVIWTLVPVDVVIILVRYTGENLLFKVPTSQGNLPPFGLVLEKTELVASYLATSGIADVALAKVLGARGVVWETFVDATEQGLRHKMHSCQRVISCFSDISEMQSDVAFVEPFDVAYAFDTSEVVVSVKNNIKVTQVERLDDFLICLRDFGSRCTKLQSNIQAVVATCRKPARGNSISSFSGCEIEATKNPTSLACLAVVDAIRSARDATEAIKLEVLASTHYLQRRLRDQDVDIARMRCLVFEKERQRLATLAVTFSSVAGWLRIGSSQRMGQRGMMTWNLSPSWCVLRKSLLFMYNGPGSFTSVDVIPVKESSLRQLAGGRKRDLKRAFALVEANGVVHVIVTGTDQEFYRWVQELSKIVGAWDGEQIAMQQMEDTRQDESLRSGHATLSRGEECDVNDDRTQPRQNRFAKALQQAAKSTGHAVAERRRRRLVIENEHQHTVNTDAEQGVFGDDTVDRMHGTKTLIRSDDDMLPTSAIQNQPAPAQIFQPPREGDKSASAQQLRNRIAGMRDATKTRVESALVAAKQKGKEVSVNARSLKTSDASSNLIRYQPSQLAAVHSSAMIDNGSGDSWTCTTCTFHNEPLSSACKMCETAREPSSVSADLFGKVEDCNIDHDAQAAREDVPQTTRTMKDRIGVAVKSLRKHGQVDSAIDDSNMRISSRLPADGNVADPPEPLRLRDVGLAGPLPPSRAIDPVHGSHIPPAKAPLRRLDGTWHVSVSLVDSSDEFASKTEFLDNIQSSLANVENGSFEPNIMESDDQSSLDAGDVLHVALRIEVQNQNHQSEFDLKSNPWLSKCLHELLALHSSISEGVSSVFSNADDLHISRNGRDLSDQAIESSLEVIQLTGKLLSELLRHTRTRGAEPFESYCVNVVSQFLNALLDSYLPEGCLLALIDFLGIADASTARCAHSTNLTASFMADEYTHDDFSCTAIPSVSSVEAGLVRAETQALLAEQVATIYANESSIVPTPCGQFGNIHGLYHPPPHPFREGMYSALVSVMEERDEIHARMVAADVVHVHEIERSRNMAKHLTNQLEQKDRELETFKRTVNKGKNISKTVDQPALLSRPISESDTELVSLSQQLSAEISSRTTASLEILRLKECRKIERQNESAERLALERELSKARDLLAQQKEKLVQGQEKYSQLKQSYERVLKIQYSESNES